MAVPPASPRCHEQHARKGVFSRVRRSKQLKAFLLKKATQLSSTSSVMYTKLRKYGAIRVKAATNISQLP